MEGKEKMREKNIIFSMLVLLLVALSSTEHAEAPSIGVSPGYLSIDNMLRGGYAERFVTVSVSTDNPVTVSAVAGGDIADWFEFNTSFQVSRDDPYRVKIISRPPADVRNGIYSGHITFTTSSLGEVGGEAGSAVQASVRVGITVSITDEQIVVCNVDSVEVKLTEQGLPVSFSYGVENNGNVRLSPSVNIAVWDQEQTRILKTYTSRGDSVLPTTRQQNVVNMPASDLELGQYWADFSINECYFSELLTFDIVERGSLTANGVLHGIFNQPWVVVGENVPLYVTFENVGEGPVLAKFKGNAHLGERVVKLLESEELLVQPGEKTNLTLFFTPNKKGKYVIKGRVFYESKRTFEKFSILNVAGGSVDITVIALYSLIALLLLFITYKLYKRKKHRS